MMQVYVDGEPLQGAGTTLSSAMEAVRAGLGGRLVIEAVADGSPVPPEHFESPPEIDPYADRLEIRTEDAAALVRFSLLEAADALERVGPSHERAAELLQRGDTEACMRELGPMFEVWGAATQTLTIARQLEQVSLPSRGCDGRSVEEMIGTLGASLHEARRCLAEEDLAGLADVLAYELAGASEGWASVLRSLAGGIESSGSEQP